MEIFIPDLGSLLTLRDPARSDVVVRQAMPPGPRVQAEWDPPNLGRHGGDPKWEIVPRPKRTDAAEWVGQEQHTRPVTLSFDGWMKGRPGLRRENPAAHRSVEEECRIVHSWTRPIGGVGSGGPMAQLRVEYGPWQQQLWWVHKARWADPLLIDGHRIRQDVTLELLEVVTVDLAFTPIDQAVETATGGTPTAAEGTAVYTVVAGDSLWAIAATHLDDANRWEEIAVLNDIPPPYIIHPGDELKLPT